MSGKIFVAPHHSTEELEHRYKAADDSVERGHLHIIWLLSQGRSTKFVAEVTGYTPTSKILWRYNDHGSRRLRQYPHRESAAPPPAPKRSCRFPVMTAPAAWGVSPWSWSYPVVFRGAQREQSQRAVHPPSIGRAMPVIEAAAGEHRNTVSSPSSSRETKRLLG
jgi:hypothetical protein